MRGGIGGGIGGGGGGGGSNSPACAACKHQRRKCAANCPLAPHFPPNRRTDFLNAHRLFGVSNILKTLTDVADPGLKAHAVKSIVFHANARAADPVGGCFRIVANLRRQIDQTAAEIGLVRRQLAALQGGGSARAAVGYRRSQVNLHAPLVGDCYGGGGFRVSEDIKPFLEMFD